MQKLSPLEYEAGVYLIGNINNDGFLVTSISELLESQDDLYKKIILKYENGEIKDLPQIDRKCQN